MATAPTITYTGRDFEANLRALKEFIQARAPESWNSYFASELGTVLLELIAYQGTLQSFTLDAQTLECFLDTLRHRESLLHFTRLTGYRLRRAAPVNLQVLARASSTPAPSDQGFRIVKGTRVFGKDGQIWEVDGEYIINPNELTPLRTELQYGDVVGRNLDANGTSTFIDALVKIDVGSSIAVLAGPDAARFPSEVNFGPRVSQGSILKLTKTLIGYSADTGVTTFGGPPPYTRDEYAVVEVSKFSYDLENYTILYLDRPWDGTTKFLGQWRIENRNVGLTQGETHEDTFRLPADTDRRNYQIKPVFYPVLSGATEPFIVSGFSGSLTSDGIGVTVLVNGTEWKPTASLLFEQADALAYEIEFDELDRAIITFGDGRFGTLLPDEAEIIVRYRTGGGAQGNVPQNAIDTTIAAQIASQASTPVTIFLSNPYTVGRGGQARETIQDAKRNIPAYVRTNDRAVTVEDYANLASNFTDPVVGRIKLAKGVLHKNTVPREQNIVWVYSWVEGQNGQLTAPTYQLKQRLLEYLNQRKMITDEVVVVDGVTAVTPMHLRFRMAKQVEPSEVTYQVQSAVNGVLTALRPGDPLYISRLYDAVQSVSGVEYSDWLSPASNLAPANDYELFVNSLQLPQLSKLLIAGVKGSNTVFVAKPELFTPLGRLSLYEAGRTPTVAIVESVTDNQVTLRTPLQDNYTLNAAMINTDFLLLGWSYERPVNVYIRFRSGAGATEAARASVKYAIQQYFRQTIRPEETLLRATLEGVLSRVPDVTEVVVNLNSLDSPIEQVVPSTNELVTLGVLSINGTVA